MTDALPARPVAPGRLVLRGGLIFDGTGSDPFRADVAVEGELIVEIGQDLAGETSADASGATVMPGLIDCHAHPAFAAASTALDDDVGRSASYATLQAIPALRATLDAGVTTVRDAAGADAGLRRAIAEGIVAGPRLVVSLSQLSPGAGPYDARTLSGHDAWVARPGIPSPVADGEAALRAKVREYAQAGADVIKIFASGNFSMPRGGAFRSMFTDGELAAIVDEAARQGLRVMAHAHGPRPAVAAARAGVASIEHGLFLDEPALDAIAAAGCVLVPTLLASAGLEAHADDDAGRERMAAIADGHRGAVRAAHAKGIPIAMGSDCPVSPHGVNDEELALLVSCGLTPLEALAAGTSVAATLLGLDEEIGRVAVGKRADLLVLDGAADDVGGFRHRLRDVFQAGRRVGPAGPRPSA